MLEIKWSLLKSKRLKQTRGVSFEEIIQAELVDVLEHPKQRHQRIMVFKHQRYIWAVPFITSEDSIFLKTIYPSRKLMSKYLWEQKK
ncbi:toxin [bacterium]|nr:toxin [bacterium]